MPGDVDKAYTWAIESGGENERSFVNKIITKTTFYVKTIPFCFMHTRRINTEEMTKVVAIYCLGDRIDSIHCGTSYFVSQ